jgi:hypothetical protein
MNAVAIILGIVIIILIYVLYKYFSSSATTLQSSLINLRTATPVTPITTIGSPTNNQFAYGVWVYVNNWDQGTNKVIFNHKGVVTLYLMNNQPSLVVDVQMQNSTTSPPSTVTSTNITNSFPLQKWVYIIVSLDNQFLDVYLDGKLVKSAKLTDAKGTAQPVVPSASPSVYLGNNSNGDKLNNSNNGTGKQAVSAATNDPWSAYLTYFYRWSTPMDPGTAWKYYMKGNGQSTLLGNISNYGVQMQIMQNNVVASSYTLL